jgi:hypothetical protein
MKISPLQIPQSKVMPLIAIELKHPQVLLCWSHMGYVVNLDGTLATKCVPLLCRELTSNSDLCDSPLVGVVGVSPKWRTDRIMVLE